ncbi:hypothetical protein ACEPAG_7222 [Sanghuangporus baumii]
MLLISPQAIPVTLTTLLAKGKVEKLKTDSNLELTKLSAGPVTCVGTSLNFHFETSARSFLPSFFPLSNLRGTMNGDTDQHEASCDPIVLQNLSIHTESCTANITDMNIRFCNVEKDEPWHDKMAPSTLYEPSVAPPELHSHLHYACHTQCPCNLTRSQDLHVQDKPKRSTKPPQTPIIRASDEWKAQKKKKTSNAFFLYRSYVLANNLLPTDVKHQNDASRVAAQMWRDESQKTRIHFFSLAEEMRKKQREMEENELYTLEPPVPALSPSSTVSSRSLYDSPPPTPSSPCVRRTPAPKIRPRDLPSSSLNFWSSTWEIMPELQSEMIPEPNYDASLLSPLSEEWYSPYPTSSLAFSDDFGYSTVDSCRRQACSYPLVSHFAFSSGNDIPFSPPLL